MTAIPAIMAPRVSIAERAETPGRIAALFGDSEEFIRAACVRKLNPVPCIDVSTNPKRHCFRIRPTVYQAWREQEEQRRG